MRELCRRNATASIAHLKLHVGGCAFPPQGECAPLGHGIEGVLHQIEDGAAERAGVKGHRIEVLQAFQLQF